MQTNISEIAVFTKKEVFGPFFPGNIECDKTQGRNYRSLKAIPTITLELITAFVRTSEVVENTNFRKKDNISSEEKILV